MCCAPGLHQDLATRSLRARPPVRFGSDSSQGLCPPPVGAATDQARDGPPEVVVHIKVGTIMILFAAPADSSVRVNNATIRDGSCQRRRTRKVIWLAGRETRVLVSPRRRTTRSGRGLRPGRGEVMGRRRGSRSATLSHPGREVIRRVAVVRRRRSLPSLVAVVRWHRSSSSSASPSSSLPRSHSLYRRRSSPSSVAVICIAVNPSLKTARPDRVRIPLVD